MSGGRGECCGRWMERKGNGMAGDREGMQLRGCRGPTEREKVHARKVRSGGYVEECLCGEKSEWLCGEVNEWKRNECVEKE